MIRDALISEDGLYRYWLLRNWVKDHPDIMDGGRVVFCQHNPSWADAFKEDPTLNRNISFAQSWGFAEAMIVNIYAYRTEDPKVLFAAQKRGVDIVGPRNAEVLAYAFLSARMVVACWGANPKSQVRAREVLANFPDVTFYCIRQTKSGAPEHPLYLPGSLTPTLYRPALKRAEQA